MQKSKEINLILTEDGDLEPNAELKRVIIEAQLDTALKGNSEMLKWLGKQYLNQTDKGDSMRINPYHL